MPQSDRPNRTQQPSHPALPARPALPSLPPSKKVIWASASDKEPPQNVPNPAARLTFVRARQSGVLRLSLPPPAALNGYRTIFFFFPFFFFLLCPRISGYACASYCPKYSQNATHCTVYHEQNGCCVTTTCVSLCFMWMLHYILDRPTHHAIS